MGQERYGLSLSLNGGLEFSICPRREDIREPPGTVPREREAIHSRRREGNEFLAVLLRDDSE